MGLASTSKLMGCQGAICNIIGVMFMNRTIAHMAHLKTSSFAAHKALNEFYDEVVDQADSLIEVAQGQYGKLDIPFVGFDGSIEDPVMMMTEQLRILEGYGREIDEEHLKNIFQEIQSLYRKTLYLLKELH